MGDGGRTISFSFAFQRPLDTWARWFAVVPTRSYVRVDDHGFEAVYGLWRVATVWANVADVERTGPYRAWKVAGPARLSWADRGITMAATTSGGVCLRFREPVGGIDPLGVIRHPAVTLGVDDLDRSFASPNSASRLPGRRQVRVAADASCRRPVGHRAGRVALEPPPHHPRTASVERVDVPLLDRAGDVDDQPVEIGVGPTFHRTYRTVVRGAALGAEEAMAAIQADLNVLADVTWRRSPRCAANHPGCPSATAT